MQRSTPGAAFQSEGVSNLLIASLLIHLLNPLLIDILSGKNVLAQKSELTRALEKRLDNQKKKEIEEDKKTMVRRNSFERKLEEQANKIKANEENQRNGSKNVQGVHSPEPAQLEFLRIHAKLNHAHNSDHTNANKQDGLNVLDNA